MKQEATGGNKRYLIWVLSLLCSMVAFCYVIMSNMVPLKYILVLGAAILIVFTGLFFLQKKMGRIRCWFSIFMEIIIAAIACYGISVLYHVNSMIDDITDTVVETEAVSAYVLNKQPWDSINQALDKNFGRASGQGYEAVSQYLDRVQTDSKKNLNVQEYDDMFLAADALLEGEVDVLVLNDAFATMISEFEGYEWFAEDVKTIDSVLEEVEVEVIKTPAPTVTPTPTPTAEPEETSEPDDTKPEDGKEEVKPTKTPKPVKAELMEPPEQVDWNSLVNQDMLAAPAGSFVVYIGGADTWGKASTKSRSDVNILAVVNTNTKKILLVSTPRDYYVPLSVSNGVKDKLTHAGNYGVQASADTLAMLYGVNVAYYVKLNFTGFVSIVDAVGGIDVYSDSSFSVENSDFSYVQGMNHLSGIEALAFVRDRHHVAGGDRSRGTHQMEVIKAVFQQAMSPAILYNYADFMNSISGAFTTNMPKDTMASLVRMQLGDMASWDIQSISVDGTGANKTTYSVPSKTAYVMIPSEASVNSAKDRIANVLNGN